MKTAIWWTRRDLRLSDNQALTAALRQAEYVVPLFVLDPALLLAPDISQNRVAFLLGGLRSLAADLRARGSGLIVRHAPTRTDRLDAQPGTHDCRVVPGQRSAG